MWNASFNACRAHSFPFTSIEQSLETLEFETSGINTCWKEAKKVDILAVNTL